MGTNDLLGIESWKVNDTFRISSHLDGVKEHNYWYDSRNRLTNVRNDQGAATIGLNYDVQGNLPTRIGVAHSFEFGNRLRTVNATPPPGSMWTPRVHRWRPATPVVRWLSASRYTPYGGSIGTATDGLGYTGHVMDATIGLTYMRQRYMDPEPGMFLSVDPVTAYEQPVGQFNRYRHANGNPFRFSDPDGRCAMRTGSRISAGAEAHGYLQLFSTAHLTEIAAQW